MTPTEVSIVQNSLSLLEHVNRAEMGAVFYEKLFSDHPGLRKMFPSDMSLQNQKVIDMLYSILTHLDKEEVFRPSLIAMGKRHLVYGVKTFHFRMVGVALLFMLQHFLKENYNKEVKHAWFACYEEISRIMQEVAEH